MIAGLIAALAAAAGAALSRWVLVPLLQRHGLIPADALRTRRRAFWLVSAVLVAYAAAATWAFASGNAVLAILIAVAVVIVPGLVAQVLSIRQARQRVRERRGTPPNRG